MGGALIEFNLSARPFPPALQRLAYDVTYQGTDRVSGAGTLFVRAGVRVEVRNTKPTISVSGGKATEVIWGKLACWTRLQGLQAPVWLIKAINKVVTVVNYGDNRWEA